MSIGTIEEDHMKIKYYPDADVLELRITDEDLDHGVQAGDEIILHYTKDDKLVKIEMLDASKTVMEILQPILSQKPIKSTTVSSATA